MPTIYRVNCVGSYLYLSCVNNSSWSVYRRRSFSHNRVLHPINWFRFSLTALSTLGRDVVHHSVRVLVSHCFLTLLSMNVLTRKNRCLSFKKEKKLNNVFCSVVRSWPTNCIGLKPKAKSHYRSHKLAMWTNLIPDLHRPSGDDVARVHHLLDDYNDPYSYDGKVRVVPATLAPTPTSTTSPSPITSAVNSSLLMVESSRKADGGGAKYGEPEASSKLTNGSRILTAMGGTAGSVRAGNGSNTEQYGAYSTALSVTIAIGCSLLILNVLIFAGVYYQRDKQRMELKRRFENGMILSASVSGEVENHASAMMSSSRLCSKPDLANGAVLNKIDSSSGSTRNTSAAVVTNTSSSVMSLSSPFNASITQLPPPEFADFPADQCPAAMGTSGAATSCAGSSTSNGRASMISNSTASFRPVSTAASSSTSTLPRMSTTGFCNNEYPLPPVTSLQQSQQQQQRSMSLRKQPNKQIASPVSNSAIDELRV